MTKELFCKALKAIEAYSKFELKMYKYGFDLGNIPEINNLIEVFTDYISQSVKDMRNMPHVYSDLSYFMYDLNFGKDYKPGMITEDGKNIRMKTPEDMWKYFVKRNPDIEDKDYIYEKE